MSDTMRISYWTEGHSSGSTSHTFLISSRHDRDEISNGSVCLLQFPDSWKIYPDDDNISGLIQALSGAGGQGSIEVKYA